MADLDAVSPLTATLRPGRHGVAGAAGLTVRERAVATAVSLAARAAGASALAGALGWPLPERPRWVEIEGGMALWTGPARWLAMGDLDLAGVVERAGHAGSVADQSDGRVVLDLGGPRVRDALAKGVAVDLHPAAFADGDVAVTSIAHVPGLLWRQGDRFGLAVPRSYAGSLIGWLLEAAAEYGVEIAPHV